LSRSRADSVVAQKERLARCVLELTIERGYLFAKRAVERALF
jgi:hypothetical protein